jgi:acylphosphatase
MSKICLHCFVGGQVQGVFYRNGVKQKAKELDINGWTRNLSDGRVEVMACGDAEKVEELREWLWDGPPRAEVTDVDVSELPYEEHDSFEVK